MYLEHFGLVVNPFGLSPKLDFLYKSETFEESMAHLIYGLDHQEAIVLITGAIGTGKTMALQSFLMNLGPRFEFALITNTQLTSVELLKLILEDLDVSFPPGSDKSDLLILFKEFLLESGSAGKRVLVVIDEAQNLPNEVLEEIRLLTNLGQGESQPVTIILVGQPELEAKVEQQDLAQLRQRIRVHYRLDPLSRREIEEYLDHRMAVAGCTRRVFDAGSVDRIFKISKGVPRLVNTMAGEALLTAFVGGRDKVQAQDIDTDSIPRFETAGPSGPGGVPGGPEVDAAAIEDRIEAALSPEPTPSPVPEPVAEIRAHEPPAPESQTQFKALPRRKRGRSSRALGGLLAAVVLVIVVGGLYFTGYLDGVLASVRNQMTAENPAQPVPETSLAGTVDEPVEETDGIINAAGEEISPAGGESTSHADEVVAVVPEEQPVMEAEVPGAETMVQETATRAEDTGEPGAGAKTLETAATAEGIHYLHISSFRTLDRANTLVKKLEEEGLRVRTSVQESRGTDWHRVYLGPFKDRETAYLEALKLQQAGVISYYRLTTMDP